LEDGLRPDPLGERSSSLRPPSRNRGPNSKGRGGQAGEGKGGERKERRRREGKGRKTL